MSLPIEAARHWERMPTRTDDATHRIKVGFWNVLCSSYVDGFVGAGSLHFSRRFGMFRERLLRCADYAVLAFTEIDHYASAWKPLLRSMNYITFYAKKSHHHAHGVMLALRMDQFAVLSIVQVYDEVAAVAVLLRHLASGQLVCAGVTHLKAKRENADVREKQLLTILERIGPLVDRADHTIFMGNLNVYGDDEPVLQHLEGALQWRRVSMLWTTWKRRAKESGERCDEEDFVFVSPSATIVGYLAVPSNAAVRKNGLLPGVEYPSDHLMLQAQVALNAVADE